MPGLSTLESMLARFGSGDGYGSAKAIKGLIHGAKLQAGGEAIGGALAGGAGGGLVGTLGDAITGDKENRGATYGTLGGAIAGGLAGAFPGVRNLANALKQKGNLLAQGAEN